MWSAMVVAALIAMSPTKDPTQHELYQTALQLDQMKPKVVQAEATAYAPLDPNAIEGVCFSGNPNITRTGTQVREGVIAADPFHLEYGTQVYILDTGKWYTVEDTGAALKHPSKVKIDIFMVTRKQAFAWGRRQTTIIVLDK